MQVWEPSWEGWKTNWKCGWTEREGRVAMRQWGKWRTSSASWKGFCVEWIKGGTRMRYSRLASSVSTLHIIRNCPVKTRCRGFMGTSHPFERCNFWEKTCDRCKVKGHSKKVHFSTDTDLRTLLAAAPTGHALGGSTTMRTQRPPELDWANGGLKTKGRPVGGKHKSSKGNSMRVMKIPLRATRTLGLQEGKLTIANDEIIWILIWLWYWDILVDKARKYFIL